MRQYMYAFIICDPACCSRYADKERRRCCQKRKVPCRSFRVSPTLLPNAAPRLVVSPSDPLWTTVLPCVIRSGEPVNVGSFSKFEVASMGYRWYSSSLPLQCQVRQGKLSNDAAHMISLVLAFQQAFHPSIVFFSLSGKTSAHETLPFCGSRTSWMYRERVVAAATQTACVVFAQPRISSVALSWLETCTRPCRRPARRAEVESMQMLQAAF